MTGCGGYFGKRLSVTDFWHMRKRDPLPEMTSFMWQQRSHKLGAIQGQRELTCLSGEDLHQEVVVPAAAAAFHGEAVAAGVLLQQRQCEAV